MVRLLLIEDDDLLTKPGIAKTLFNSASGHVGQSHPGSDPNSGTTIWILHQMTVSRR
jgi:hypothetical protein